MDQPVGKFRTIRAVRRRSTPPVVSTRTAPEPEPELSNYELLERRSQELELERAHGGPGTSQPPDAETPLLFARPSSGENTREPEARGRGPRRQSPRR